MENAVKKLLLGVFFLLKQQKPPLLLEHYVKTWWLKGRVPASCSGDHEIESRLGKKLSVSGGLLSHQLQYLLDISEMLKAKHIYLFEFCILSN